MFCAVWSGSALFGSVPLLGRYEYMGSSFQRHSSLSQLFKVGNQSRQTYHKVLYLVPFCFYCADDIQCTLHLFADDTDISVNVKRSIEAARFSTVSTKLSTTETLKEVNFKCGICYIIRHERKYKFVKF